MGRLPYITPVIRETSNRGTQATLFPVRLFYPGNDSSALFRNVVTDLPVHTTLHPRRQLLTFWNFGSLWTLWSHIWMRRLPTARLRTAPCIVQNKMHTPILRYKYMPRTRLELTSLVSERFNAATALDTTDTVVIGLLNFRKAYIQEIP